MATKPLDLRDIATRGWVTASELAVLLQMPESRVKKLLDADEIEHVVVNGRPRIYLDEVERFKQRGPLSQDENEQLIRKGGG